jgi:regulatory protein
VTVRALARRDRSRSELDERLVRAGVREADRRVTIDRAARVGLVDDARFARARARSLAERGAGDALILEDLARRGIEDGAARVAVSELEPEDARAARIVEVRGRTARTLRYLASRGFGEESLDGLVAELEDRALP